MSSEMYAMTLAWLVHDCAKLSIDFRQKDESSKAFDGGQGVHQLGHFTSNSVLFGHVCCGLAGCRRRRRGSNSCATFLLPLALLALLIAAGP